MIVESEESMNEDELFGDQPDSESGSDRGDVTVRKSIPLADLDIDLFGESDDDVVVDSNAQDVGDAGGADREEDADDESESELVQEVQEVVEEIIFNATIPDMEGPKDNDDVNISRFLTQFLGS